MLARAALGGIDPLAMLTERDHAKQGVLQAVVERIEELAGERRQDLAIRLSNAMNGQA